MLNPPERIALDEVDSWLSKETTVYAWLQADGQPVSIEGIEIVLEVLSKGGEVLRTSSKRTSQGRVVFPTESYILGTPFFERTRVSLALLRQLFVWHHIISSRRVTKWDLLKKHGLANLPR